MTASQLRYNPTMGHNNIKKQFIDNQVRVFREKERSFWSVCLDYSATYNQSTRNILRSYFWSTREYKQIS